MYFGKQFASKFVHNLFTTLAEPLTDLLLQHLVVHLLLPTTTNCPRQMRRLCFQNISTLCLHTNSQRLSKTFETPQQLSEPSRKFLSFSEQGGFLFACFQFRWWFLFENQKIFLMDKVYNLGELLWRILQMRKPIYIEPGLFFSVQKIPLHQSCSSAYVGLSPAHH